MRARAPWRLCKKGPEFLTICERVPSLFLCVADRSQKGPCVSFYSRLEVHDGARAPPRSGELADRPIGAVTGAKLRPRPNPSPQECFPQPNCTNSELSSSVRVNRMDGGQLIVFPVMGELAVQIGGSASIVGM
jgi:hypothetical protein